MKKRVSFLLVVALILTTLIPAIPVLAADETVQNTFIDENAANIVLTTADDYIKFFNHLYVWGNKTFKGQTVTLAGDIVFNDTTVEGWYTKADAKKLNREQTNKWSGFEGTFDGGNHTLKGVIVEGNWTSQNATALFSMVWDGATIKNLNVDGFYVCGTNGSTCVGSLIGKVMGANVTVDHCTVSNGIVTGAQDATAYLGALIGMYQPGNTTNGHTKITDSVVSNVQVVKGETNSAGMGGMFGRIALNDESPCLDLSGSVVRPSDAAMNPVGGWSTWGKSKSIEVRNDANGFTGSCSSLADVQTQLNACGIYGVNAMPTMKLAGVQNSTTGNGIRFVGLIKKSAIEAGTVAALGFEISAGGKSAEVECTKVYESILEDGKTLTAPEGYYFFTFVVTDVAAGTEFAVNAVAAVSEKECTTTEGIYTYPHTVS